MAFATELITGPTEEPVSLSEASAHLLLNHAESEADVALKIRESRRDAEIESGRAFVTQTWKLYLDGFPKALDPLYLPFPPCQSVSSVQYYDGDGTLQTLSGSAYFSALKGDSPRLVPVDSWPSTQSRRPQAVIVTFVCGYGAAADVPADIKAAVKLILGSRWANRGDSTGDSGGDTIPPGARRILMNYRAPDLLIQEG